MGVYIQVWCCTSMGEEVSEYTSQHEYPRNGGSI